MESYEEQHPIDYLFDEKQHPMMMVKGDNEEGEQEEPIIYIDDVKDEQGNIICPDYLKEADQRYYLDLERERYQQQIKDNQAEEQQINAQRLLMEQVAVQEREKLIYPEEERKEQDPERFIVNVVY